MKVILGLITILILGLGISGQNDAKQSKKMAKEQQRADRQRALDELKIKDAENAKRTVDLKTLEVFPDEYLGRPLRLQGLILKDVRLFSDSAGSGYLLEVRSESGAFTMTLPLADRISLTAPTEIARYAVERMSQLPSDYSPIVDLWFEMRLVKIGQQNYYVANVSCMIFRQYKGTPPSVGTCPF